jgi:membrane-bound metal-dependent hydrolase YbcI (DUF457 family)
MMGRSHVVIAGAGYLTVAALAPGALGHLAPGQLAAGGVCACGASLLPDLDCPGSSIARALGPVSDLLARLVSLIAGGHRRGTHSLLAWVAVSGALALALHGRYGLAVALIVCVLAGALMLHVISGAGAVVCAVVALGAGVGLVFGVGSVSRWMPAAVLVGYGSHLLGDFVTVRGVPLLWPLSNCRQSLALIGATDDRREQLVCLGAAALGVYLAFTLIAAPAFAAG